MATETEAADGDAQTTDNDDSHNRFHLDLFGNELNVKDYRNVVEIFYSAKEARRVMYANGGQGNESTRRGDKIRLVVDSDHRYGDSVRRITIWSQPEHADSIRETYWRADARWDAEEGEWSIKAKYLEEFIDDLLYNGEDVQLSMEVVELLAE